MKKYWYFVNVKRFVEIFFFLFVCRNEIFVDGLEHTFNVECNLTGDVKYKMIFLTARNDVYYVAEHERITNIRND